MNIKIEKGVNLARPATRPPFDPFEAAAPVTIERGVPMPVANKRRYAGVIEHMQVGDSFLIPKAESKAADVTLAGAFTRYHRPKKFVSRLTPEGRRIWRVA